MLKNLVFLAVAAAWCARPALAKPGISVEVSLEASALRAGMRDVKVTVLSPTTQDFRIEVVRAGAVDLAKSPPARLHVEAGRPSRFSVRLKQQADEEAHVLVRLHGKRGAKEASLDLAPEVTAHTEKQAPKAPVDRTADGKAVMR